MRLAGPARGAESHKHPVRTKAVTRMDAEGRRTILVVDDERDVVAIARVNLELAGFEVIEAFSGEQALQRMQERTPDLVLLDIRMPGVSGLGVLTEMRKSQATCKVPVVMFTAYGDINTRAECEALGCYFFVDKPFDPAELVRIIKRVLAAADEERLIEESPRT
jgi:DNA-binding NtrC family response regulator